MPNIEVALEDDIAGGMYSSMRRKSRYSLFSSKKGGILPQPSSPELSSIATIKENHDNQEGQIQSSPVGEKETEEDIVAIEDVCTMDGEDPLFGTYLDYCDPRPSSTDIETTTGGIPPIEEARTMNKSLVDDQDGNEEEAMKSEEQKSIYSNTTSRSPATRKDTLHASMSSEQKEQEDSLDKGREQQQEETIHLKYSINSHDPIWKSLFKCFQDPGPFLHCGTNTSSSDQYLVDDDDEKKVDDVVIVQQQDKEEEEMPPTAIGTVAEPSNPTTGDKNNEEIHSLFASWIDYCRKRAVIKKKKEDKCQSPFMIVGMVKDNSSTFGLESKASSYIDDDNSSIVYKPQPSPTKGVTTTEIGSTTKASPTSTIEIIYEKGQEVPYDDRMKNGRDDIKVVRKETSSPRERRGKDEQTPPPEQQPWIKDRKAKSHHKEIWASPPTHSTTKQSIGKTATTKASASIEVVYDKGRISYDEDEDVADTMDLNSKISNNKQLNLKTTIRHKNDTKISTLTTMMMKPSPSDHEDAVKDGMKQFGPSSPRDVGTKQPCLDNPVPVEPREVFSKYNGEEDIILPPLFTGTAGITTNLRNLSLVDDDFDEGRRCTVLGLKGTSKPGTSRKRTERWNHSSDNKITATTRRWNMIKSSSKGVIHGQVGDGGGSSNSKTSSSMKNQGGGDEGSGGMEGGDCSSYCHRTGKNDCSPTRRPIVDIQVTQYLSPPRIRKPSERDYVYN